MKFFTNRTALVLSVSAIAALATVADARHQWRKYEWAYDGTPIAAPVVDNTSGTWPGRVGTAVSDWNASSRIDAAYQNGNSNNTTCDFVLGEIQVCNDDYGSTGWLGIASITINGNEILAGYTKLNDYYFNQPRYDTESWKQLVACQEIGHDYGLGHQNENFNTDATTSCMEYTSWPEGNESPDQHDYDQLERMYTAGDDGGGGGKPGGGGGNGGGRGKPATLPAVGNTPDSWGRPVQFLPNGMPHVYARDMNGYRVITHVTWTIEAARDLDPHGHRGGHDHDH
jgi:hypothetical protein